MPPNLPLMAMIKEQLRPDGDQPPNIPQAYLSNERVAQRHCGAADENITRILSGYFGLPA